MWQKSHHTKPHHSVLDVTEFGTLNCPELHTHTKKCRVKTSSIETVMDVTARNKRMWQKSHHTKPNHSVMDMTEFGALKCPELHTHSKKWRVKTSSNETVMDVTARNNRMWQSFCYGHDGNKRLETALSYSDTHKRNRDKTRSIETVRDATFNVCDLLNHHGCDRVSVTDMTEIRGGKLHWARCTHSKVIGMKPVVLKLFGMWKKSLICIWNTVRGKGGLL